MTMRFKRILVIAIVFAITFVNYGLPLQAIAAESTGFLFGANLFKKDEIALKAYFDDDNAQKTKVLNVNDTARLTVEVTPLIEGYLKSGSLKLNFTNGNENNFRIQKIEVESEDKEIVPEADSAQEMVQDVEDIIPVEPAGKDEPNEDKPIQSFLTEGTKDTLQNVKSIPGGLESLLNGSAIESLLQQEPVEEEKSEDVVVDNSITEMPVQEEEKLEATIENKPETEKEDEKPIEENKGLSDLLVSEKTEEVETTIFEEIVVVKENEIELNNVIDNTKIYVDIVYKQSEAIKVEDLYNNIKITLEGNYINKNLDVLEVVDEDEITLGWEYSKEVDVISNYVKVSPFTVGENLGTIVTNDVIIRRAIKEPNYLPLKETNIKLIIPKINDKLPTAVNVIAENLMATCGQELNEVVFTQDDWTYDEATGEMQITVRNEKAVVSQGDDKFTIICRYEDYVNTETIALEKNIVVKVEEYNSNSNKVYEKELKEVEEKEIYAGEVITYTASATEEKINKGRINANYNAEVQYETEFSTILNVNLLTSDLLEEIKIEGFKDVYVDAENKEFDASKDVMYKKVKLYYSEVKDMLEKGTTIDLLDENDNVLHTLTKENTTNQDGCDLEITQRVKQAKIRINNIQTNGNITIEFVKVIAKSNYSLIEFNNFEKIVSKSKAFVKYVDMEERFALKEVEAEKVFTESQTKATLNINKEYLSTVKDNYNVELKIELNNNLETSDLYKNPVFEIVFPGYIKDVEIQNMNLFHEDGLRVNDFKTFTQDGEIRLKLELIGTQKSFCESSLTNGSNIIINANIKVDEATPRKQDEIRLFYFNEAATNYQAETEWNIDKGIPGNIVKAKNGFDAAVIEYQAPVGLIAINSIENYDGQSSVLKSVKQGEVKDMLFVGKPAQRAKIRISTLNNTGNDCTDMCIVGRVSFEGNKHIETGKDLGSTLTIPMLDLIEEDSENKIKAKIYYSTNGEATRELYANGNNWSETVEDISKVKSFLIVPEGTFNAGEILNYSYNVEIPANLPYEGKIYGTFTAYYNNHTEYATVYEATTADKVGLETEPGPKIEASMSVDIGEGTEVKEGKVLEYTVNVKNTGSIIAENVYVKMDAPTHTRFVEFKTMVNDSEISGIEYVELESAKQEVKINNLKPNESQEVKLLVRTLEEISDERENENYIIEAEAEIEVSNFAIKTKTNTIKNKLVNGNFIIKASANIPNELNDRSIYTYNYQIKNSSQRDLENAKIICELPRELKYEESSIELITDENLQTIYNEEKHCVEVEIPKFVLYTKANLRIKLKVAKATNELVTPKLTVKADGIEEQAAALNSKIDTGVLEAKVELDKEDVVKEREEVVYKVVITNIGKTDASEVVVQAIPSMNLENVSINFEGSSTGAINKVDGKYETIFRDLKANSEIEIIIKGIATDLENETEEKIIENQILVNYCGEDVASLISNSITIVNNYEIEEVKQEEKIVEDILSEENSLQLNKEESSINNNEDELIKEELIEDSLVNSPVINEVKEEVVLPEKEPVKEEPIEEKYIISGRVWNDKNKNGAREVDEEFLNGIDVELYQGKELLMSTKTNSVGFYNFAELLKGKYTIVFNYDGEIYTATTYNKENVAQKVSSKAIEVVEGKASSNELTIDNANIEYINLGLVVREKFNLAINKYVTKAVINIDDKKEEYDFEDLKLAKIEIDPGKLNKSIVDLTYKIVIENIGNVDGYAAMINDLMPEGMIFNKDVNNGWYLSDDGTIYNDTLKDKVIKPGEKLELILVLSKHMTEENTGIISNKVLLENATTEADIKENKEYNLDSQEVLILVKTGYTVPIILVVIVTTITIMIVSNKKIYFKTKDKGSNKMKKNLFKKVYR